MDCSETLHQMNQRWSKDAVAPPPQKLYDRVKQRREEGVVIKPLSDHYRLGKREGWRRLKPRRIVIDALIIGGTFPPPGEGADPERRLSKASFLMAILDKPLDRCGDDGPKFVSFCR